VTASPWGFPPTTSSAASSPTAPSRPLARLRAVLFDVDRTLLDFDKAERAALRQALHSLGLPCPRATLAAYQRINHELWAAFRRGEVSQPALAKERFRRLLRETGGDPAQAPRLGATYLERLSARGDRLPGCRPVLRALGARYRLGVVTNGIDHVQRSRLAASGLSPLFETVVTSQGCGYAKPDPRILHVALDTLRVSPRHAVYVGDDPAVDGAAARAAGVPFVWMDRGDPVRGVRPRRRVRSLTELPDLL
jgi:YjjG family noncanonical pyrimidine nucleotidase